ncbi:MAG: hypothetical protein OXC95_09140, partial [Dehalococcoidia bacterium]|nr:hypothetical protein [Dehalococcoidia bacterium]
MTASNMANRILADIGALELQNTPSIRGVRRKCSREIRDCEPDFVFDLAIRLIETRQPRWVAYELIRFHKATFETLTEVDIERIGQGIDSW